MCVGQRASSHFADVGSFLCLPAGALHRRRCCCCWSSSSCRAGRSCLPRARRDPRHRRWRFRRRHPVGARRHRRPGRPAEGQPGEGIQRGDTQGQVPDGHGRVDGGTAEDKRAHTNNTSEANNEIGPWMLGRPPSLGSRARFTHKRDHRSSFSTRRSWPDASRARTIVRLADAAGHAVSVIIRARVAMAQRQTGARETFGKATWRRVEKLVRLYTAQLEIAIELRASERGR